MDPTPSILSVPVAPVLDAPVPAAPTQASPSVDTIQTQPQRRRRRRRRRCHRKTDYRERQGKAERNRQKAFWKARCKEVWAGQARHQEFEDLQDPNYRPEDYDLEVMEDDGWTRGEGWEDDEKLVWLNHDENGNVVDEDGYEVEYDEEEDDEDDDDTDFGMAGITIN